MTTPRTSSHRRRTRAAVASVAVAVTALLTVTASGAFASDTLPWEGESAVGENQPYQHGYTAPELLKWDPASDRYAEMLRSHVPLQQRIDANSSTQRNPQLPSETQMITLAGDYGNSFFESQQGTNEFSQYLFNFWQYTDVYAPWHGMPVEGVPVDYYDPSLEWTQKWFEFGMLNLPNPAYTNAAHVNGALSIACIFFSANDRGDQTYRELLVRGADGSFPVAAKLIEVAEYYGFDGYFINQEELAGVDAADVPVYKEFLKALRDGGMYVQWYDSTNSPDGSLGYQNEFNSVNSPWVQDAELGRVSDSMFLNYWWSSGKLASSQAHAESLGLDPLETVYAGVEAGKDQFAQGFDLDQIFDESGAPRVSVATLGADFVSSDYANKTDDTKQWEVFDRERRWWTGSSAGATTPEGGWDGVSKYIAERSVVSGPDFSTNFSTGHGLSTWVDGELSSEAEWGDINRQDYLPTWQWWIESASTTPLVADFDYGPQYVSSERFEYEPVGGFNGGNSLVLSGRVDADNTARLFQTDLDVTADSKVQLSYAKPVSDDSELRVAAIFASDPSTIVELPVAESGAATQGWRTTSVELGDRAGDRLITLGLTVGAGAQPIEGYQVNIGALRVMAGAMDAPDAPRGFAVDEYLPASDELFVSWNLDDWAEVRRYELYLDEQYLGGGYDRALYIKDVPSRSGTLRLVAVAPDGSRSEAASVPFDASAAPMAVTAVQDEARLDVTWTTASAGAATVTLRELDSDESWRQSAASGTTAVSFEGVPTDGGEYSITVAPSEASTAATARRSFIDTEITAYPVEAARFAGMNVRLTRPTLDDWHTLTIEEDGRALQFDTTYSQGQRPYIIRGRTTYPAMNPVLSSSTSEVVAIIADYAGNTARTVLRAGPTTEPTPGPTTEPTPGPTTEPTPGPTTEPTPGPTPGPTTEPTAEPTPAPTSSATAAPAAPGSGAATPGAEAGSAGTGTGSGTGSGWLASTGGDALAWLSAGAVALAMIIGGLVLRRRRLTGTE